MNLHMDFDPRVFLFLPIKLTREPFIETRRSKAPEPANLEARDFAVARHPLARLLFGARWCSRKHGAREESFRVGGSSMEVS
jgi:hypothetical protein